MATALSLLVEALKDDLGAEAVIVNGSLWSDNQLARTIRSALRYLRGRLPSHLPDLTYTSTDNDGNVTVDSSVSLTINPDGQYGALVMAAARYQLANAGALIRAKQSFGSMSTVAGSFSQSSRSTGLRLVAADQLKELELQIAAIKGSGTNTIGEVTNVASDTIQTTVL